MTWEGLTGVLFFLLPVILGALIGYVTNDIAVRMLFRPLREYRVLGMRLPFTPGIIPKQRASLARNIGKMVSRQLITPDTVRKHLGDESTRRSIADELARSLEQWASLPLSQALPFQNRSGQISELPLIAAVIRQVLELLLPPFLNSRPADLFGRSDETVAKISANLQAFLQAPENRQAFLKFVRDRLDLMESQHRDFSSLAGPQALPLAATALRTLYTPMTEALIQALKREPSRSALIRGGRVFLSQVLERLNGFQKFLLSAVQYDKNLDENMPVLMDDLLAQTSVFLLEDERREEFSKALLSGLEKIMNRDWSTIAEPEKEQFKTRLCDLADRAYGYAADRIGEPQERFWEPFVRETFERSFGSLLEDYFGWDREKIAAYLATKALEAAQTASKSDRSLQEVFGLPRQEYDRAAAWLCETVLRTVEPHIERLLAGMDLEKMVEDKINALEMADVEQLLMTVIKKHLKWINVFGALLGGLIGAIQTLFPRV